MVNLRFIFFIVALVISNFVFSKEIKVPRNVILFTVAAQEKLKGKITDEVSFFKLSCWKYSNECTLETITLASCHTQKNLSKNRSIFPSAIRTSTHDGGLDVVFLNNSIAVKQHSSEASGKYLTEINFGYKGDFKLSSFSGSVKALSTQTQEDFYTVELIPFPVSSTELDCSVATNPILN